MESLVNGLVWRHVVGHEAPAFRSLGSTASATRRRAEKGERLIWLEERWVNRLRAQRGPGESYSDVILRLAGGRRPTGPPALRIWPERAKNWPAKTGRIT
jgi:hypothetical protein